MGKNALLLRFNPEHWPWWVSKLSADRDTSVWFIVHRLCPEDIRPGIPVIVLATHGIGVVAQGETSSSVEFRADPDWRDSPPERRAANRELKNRVRVKIRRVDIPLFAIQDRPSIAFLHQTARDAATWMTEAQYRAFCDLCRISRSEAVNRSAMQTTIASDFPLFAAVLPTPRSTPEHLSAASIPTAPITRDDFANILATFSVRAGHILHDLGIRDFARFLELTEAQLLKCRNCGKKTVTEILEIQAKLRSPESEPPDFSKKTIISFENAPAEVFDAIRGSLDVRANNTLKDMSINSLPAFMKLNKDHILPCRSCGKKTVSRILRLQAAIAEFAQERSHDTDGFRPEMLLAAPCLAGITEDEDSSSPAETVLADPENAAPWLVAWVHGLAQSEQHARVFMLRMGMLGCEPLTLETISHEFGVTRERIRQLQVLIEKKIENQYQQFRLRPIIEAAAVVVSQQGGMVDIADLTKVVFDRGKDGDQLVHATSLMSFFSHLEVWKSAGLQPESDGIIFATGFEVPAQSPITELPLWQERGRKARPRAYSGPMRMPEPAAFDPNDLTI